MRHLALAPLLILIACGGDTARAPGPSAPADAGAADSGAVADAGVAVDAGAPDSGATPAPTFTELVEVFRFQCQGCHFVTDLPPRIFLEGDDIRGTYDRLVGVRVPGLAADYVTPGDAEASYLLAKIEDRHRTLGGDGNHMPPPAARRRVPAEDVARIRAWIEGGAAF